MKRGMFLSFVELIQLNQSNSDLLQAVQGGSQVMPAKSLTDGRKCRAPIVGGRPKPKTAPDVIVIWHVEFTVTVNFIYLLYAVYLICILNTM